MMIIQVLFLLAAFASSLALPLSVSAGLLMLVAATLIPTKAQRWQPARGMDALQLAWLLWVPLTLFWSLSVGLALDRVGTLLCLPLAYIIGRRLALHPFAESGMRLLLWTLVALLAVWGLLQGPETFTHKPQGPFNDPNTYAGVLGLLALPLLAHYLATDLLQWPRWRRIAYLAVFGAAALVFLLIASRGATLALLLVLPPILWLARYRTWFARKFALLAVVVASAYLCSSWLKSGSQDVLLRLAETITEGDSIRLMLFRSTLGMIADHPLLGTGLGSFRLLYPRYRLQAESISGGSWVHNDYLQLWQEAGLPMLLILLLLLAWVVREAWRTLRSGQGRGAELERMGYLAGVMVVFMQAATNFMFYFSFVSLVVGLYLARASGAATVMATAKPAPRSWRMATVAYGAILAFLLTGQLAVETLLDRTYAISREFSKLVPGVSKYELAYWLSILAPFHPTPQHLMGSELVDVLDIMQGGRNLQGDVFNEALWRLRASQRLAPCYVPYGIDTLRLLLRHREGADWLRQSELQVERNLACNPHHGLSFYYAGLLREIAGDRAGALRAWHSRLADCIFFADRLILAAAIMSRTSPDHEKELEAVVDQLVKAAYFIETHPNVRLDQQVWTQAQLRMQAVNRSEFLNLLLPYRKQVAPRRP